MTTASNAYPSRLAIPPFSPYLINHHRDQFSRLIAAIAMVEGLTVISADSAFDAYGLTRIR